MLAIVEVVRQHPITDARQVFGGHGTISQPARDFGWNTAECGSDQVAVSLNSHDARDVCFPREVLPQPYPKPIVVTKFF